MHRTSWHSCSWSCLAQKACFACSCSFQGAASPEPFDWCPYHKHCHSERPRRPEICHRQGKGEIHLPKRQHCRELPKIILPSRCTCSPRNMASHDVQRNTIQQYRRHNTMYIIQCGTTCCHVMESGVLAAWSPNRPQTPTPDVFALEALKLGAFASSAEAPKL